MEMPKLAYESKALESACEKLGLKLVVLFGSRATGSPPPQDSSDLDLAVRRPPKTVETVDLYSALFDVFPTYDLDLVSLEETDPLFRYEIFSRGRLLYGDEMDFLEWKARAYREYMDSQDLRNLEEILFQKKITWIKQQIHGTA